MLATATFCARRLGFSRADEITIVFCGSKKSLVSGIPMANVLFAGPTLGLIVLPLMIFHQLQLMACAAVARRYARDTAPETAAPEDGRGSAQANRRAATDFSERDELASDLVVSVDVQSSPQLARACRFCQTRTARGSGARSGAKRPGLKSVPRY
jgi:hypothetical protein